VFCLPVARVNLRNELDEQVAGLCLLAGLELPPTLPVLLLRTVPTASDSVRVTSSMSPYGNGTTVYPTSIKSHHFVAAKAQGHLFPASIVA
jgi:hypothetical protein